MSCTSSSWLKSASQLKDLESLHQQMPRFTSYNGNKRPDLLSKEYNHDSTVEQDVPSTSNHAFKVLEKNPHTTTSRRWIDEYSGGKCESIETRSSQSSPREEGQETKKRPSSPHPSNSWTNGSCHKKQCVTYLDSSSWDWDGTVANGVLSPLGLMEAAKDWHWTPTKHYELDSDASDWSDGASDGGEIQVLDATRRLEQLWKHLMKSSISKALPDCDCKESLKVVVDPKDQVKVQRLIKLVNRIYSSDLSTGRYSPLFLPE